MSIALASEVGVYQTRMRAVYGYLPQHELRFRSSPSMHMYLEHSLLGMLLGCQHQYRSEPITENPSVLSNASPGSTEGSQT